MRFEIDPDGFPATPVAGGDYIVAGWLYLPPGEHAGALSRGLVEGEKSVLDLRFAPVGPEQREPADAVAENLASLNEIVAEVVIALGAMTGEQEFATLVRTTLRDASWKLGFEFQGERGPQGGHFSAARGPSPDDEHSSDGGYRYPVNAEPDRRPSREPDGEAATRAAFPVVPAGQIEAEVAADVRRLTRPEPFGVPDPDCWKCHGTGRVPAGSVEFPKRTRRCNACPGSPLPGKPS